MTVLYKHYLKSTGVSTDTRKIKEGNIFFALRGPNFNANAHASEALQKGASFAVIDDPEYATDDRCILVDDTLKALQDLAAHHRDQLSIPVIALTGSNGKTTTKELIREVLAPKYKVLATEGNLNNHIGVPITILSITKKHEIAVIEMGANHVGEIAALCQIAKPTHGLITNIGRAHLGEFGGMENILRAKSELYDYLIKTDGVIFVNSTNETLMNMVKRMKNPVLYPQVGDFYHCAMTKADPDVYIRTEEGCFIATNLPGKYNFDNLATALCISRYFEVPYEFAYLAAADYKPANNRSQIMETGSNTLILDAYNANPTSMQAAVETIADMKRALKGVILGDMFELGDDTAEEHKKIGQLVAGNSFSLVIFCGKHMRHAHEACPESLYFEEKGSLENHLKDNSPKDHTILIKGSRGMGLETIVPYL